MLVLQMEHYELKRCSCKCVMCVYFGFTTKYWYYEVFGRAKHHLLILPLPIVIVSVLHSDSLSPFLLDSGAHWFDGSNGAVLSVLQSHYDNFVTVTPIIIAIHCL